MAFLTSAGLVSTTRHRLLRPPRTKFSPRTPSISVWPLIEPLSRRERNGEGEKDEEVEEEEREVQVNKRTKKKNEK